MYEEPCSALLPGLTPSSLFRALAQEGVLKVQVMPSAYAKVLLKLTSVRRAVQVTWYQTPDRAVLSFVNVSTPGGAPSSWQASLTPLVADQPG